jgi:hypothetical protein
LKGEERFLTITKENIQKILNDNWCDVNPCYVKTYDEQGGPAVT